VAVDREAALLAWKADPSPGKRDACFEAWLPLVQRVWGRVRVSLPPSAEHLSEDLLQCGAMGLMQALDSYKAGSGASFETWARLRIRGAMLDELRRQDWISKERRRRWKALQRAVGELENRLERPCSDDELAVHLGLSLEALHEELLENAPGTMIFLDGLAPDGTLPLHERLADLRQAAADQGPLDQEMKAALADAIGRLPLQERTLLVLLLQEELGHKEAAQVLGVTPGRVSQIYAKAVLRLQAALAPKFTV
jgi:RNA polymerase sigma factor for flagellar operon FliA